MTEISDNRWRAGIQVKLSLILILAITSVLSGFSLFYYCKTKSAMQKELCCQADFFAENLSASLSMPLWEMRENLIENIIDSAMLEKQIFAVLIKNEKKTVYGKKRDSSWNIVGTSDVISGNYCVRSKAVASKDEENLGTVEVYMTWKFLQKELDRSAVGMFAVCVAVNMFLFFITFFSLKKWVILPVTHVIRGISRGTEQIFSSSGQVASASQLLAQGNSAQAEASENISSSLEKISDMAKQNADSAARSDSFMKEVTNIIGKAIDSMNRLKDSMENIVSAGKATSGLVKTIDEIAFQTNLLALNAAVEAARAGEAGGGFAVVAGEVKNLATRASEAARNTSSLIEDTLAKIETGGRIALETRENFSETAAYTNKVGELTSRIAQTSKDQSHRIAQLNHAVREIDKLIQNNAADAEETASASAEMNAQVEKIKTFANELILLTGKKHIESGSP
ncbi:MAG: methyl-accepting chemotaxis protein [Desulfobacterales bacterium]